GLVTRRVPTKGFRCVLVTSLPPFPSFPGAVNVPFFFSGVRTCYTGWLRRATTPRQTVGQTIGSAHRRTFPLPSGNNSRCLFWVLPAATAGHKDAVREVQLVGKEGVDLVMCDAVVHQNERP